MKSVFDGAVFGDKFRTRDGRMIIYMNPVACNAHCVAELNNEPVGTIFHHADFRCVIDDTKDCDVIGRWEEEPIDMDKLRCEASVYADKNKHYYGEWDAFRERWEHVTDYEDVKNAYIAGYCKAQGI